MKFFKNLFYSNKSNIEKNERLKVSDFQSVEHFWKFITQNKDWYLEFLPENFEDLSLYMEKLAPEIIKTTNNLRYNLNFKKENYWRIIQWDNIVYEMKIDDKLKQYCSNCKAEMNVIQRYPRLLCNDCKKKLKSADGRSVEFFNTEVLGHGCQGYYSGSNQTEKYNATESFIENKTFIAEEGKFGGIVIELKE